MKKLNLILMFLILLLAQTSIWAEPSQPLHLVKDYPVAPDFSLTDINGKQHKLQNYKGKVVVLNFWATWCPPCRFELPSMDRAYTKFKKEDIVLLAINVGENADTIFTFTADYPVTFSLLMDSDSSVIKKYPVIGLPTTFIVNPEGRIIYRAVGTRKWDDSGILDTLVLLKKLDLQ